MKKIISIETISRFLNWPASRIAYSLDRFKLIEDKIISKEAIDRLPTDYSARPNRSEAPELKSRGFK